MVTSKKFIVKNEQELFANKFKPGDIIMCSDSKKLFIQDKEQNLIQIQTENKGLEFNLYDLNKNIINQLNPLTKDEITLKIGIIEDYQQTTENTYHMLLCKDFNYYTVFNFSVISNFSTFSEALITIITELGEVYSIDSAEGNALEIWIKPTGEETPYAFYLFPYDRGIVYYG